MLLAFILSALSGVLVGLSFPNAYNINYGIPYIILFALVPFFYAISQIQKKTDKTILFRVIICTLTFGVILHIVAFSWYIPAIINEIDVSTFVALILFIISAPFFAIYYLFLFSPLLLNSFHKFGHELISIPIISILFTTLEIVIPRNIHWAFGQLDSGQIFLQLSSLFGCNTGTFIILMNNLFLTRILTHSFELRKIIIFLATIWIVVIGYGVLHIYNMQDKTNFSTARVGYIQPNFEFKFLRSDKIVEFERNEIIMKKLMDMVDAIIMQSLKYDNHRPDLFVFPESVMPTNLLMDFKKQNIFVEKSKKILIPFLVEDVVRFPIDASKILIWSISVLITEQGVSQKNFAKWVPMPFGESIPFETFIPKFGDYVRKILIRSYKIERGESYQSLDVSNKFKVAPLICFDSISQKLAYMYAKFGGADFYANQANFAIFGRSSAGFQFERVVQSRAIENARSIIFINNTGPSSVFDSIGQEIILSSKVMSEAYGFVDIPIYRSRTIFSYVYNLPILLGALLGLLYILKLIIS